MAYPKHLRHVLVTAGLVLAVGACVDTPAGTAPELGAPAEPRGNRVGTTSDEQLVAPGDLTPIARYLKKPHAQDYWIKQWIGPRGGVVDFLGFRIIVPPGAVDRVTKFEIRIPGSTDPAGQEHVWAEFGPHNVDFQVPVRIELPYRNSTAYGKSSGVMWYDSRARIWVPMGGGITADSARVYFDVPHFSDWGTCDGDASACSPPSVMGGGAAGSGG